MIKPAFACALACSAVLACALSFAPVARAQDFGASTWSDQDLEDHASPEHFTWELRLGTYTPNTGGSAFTQVFPGDSGPMVALELDAHIVRIPYVGILGLGVSAGWARYSGRSCTTSGGTLVCPTGSAADSSGEKAKLSLFPISTMAVLRIDALARELDIPFVFTGKLGLDTLFFRSTTGSRTDGKGHSLGLRWGVQVALELDFLDMHAARALDEDWGINHSFLFFELYGSTANSTLPLGDRTFAAGLGMTF